MSVVSTSHAGNFGVELLDMSVLFILIGASLVLALCFLACFIYMVRTGQFDDDYTPSVRILFDDKTDSSPKKPD